MKSGSEKSSSTTSATATQAANQPFFGKAGSGFFEPASANPATTIQPKMAVNQPGDKFEQEADKMADKVMRMPDPAGKEEKVQRQADDKLQKKEEEKILRATGPEDKIQKAEKQEENIQKAEKQEDKIQKAEVKEDKVQKAEKQEEQVQKAEKQEDKIQKAEKQDDKIRKAAGPEKQIQKAEDKTPKKEEEKILRQSAGAAPAVGAATQSAIRSQSAGGQPLAPEVRSFMEPRFGVDFSQVRIHHDAEAAGLSEQLSARAFTYQDHVFFSRDQYQPGTSEGRQLLAHELTHTLQQGAAVQRKAAVPAATPGLAPTSSEVVDISSNTFKPSEKVKAEIEAQGYKGLLVRTIIKGLTSEGQVKVRIDKAGNYDSIGKGSMPLLNPWADQLGGMHLNFTVHNSALKQGYASLKPGGGDTNDWLQALQKNAALLGGLGLKVGALPTPVNKLDNGKLTLGVSNLKVQVAGFVDANFSLSLENTAKPRVEATADINVKGMAKGQLKMDNSQDKLAGEVSLGIEFKAFSGQGKVKYNADGTVDIGGKAAYNANKLSGEIQFVATDLETANRFAKDAIAAAGGKENVQTAGPPGPVPVPKPGKKEKGLAASGQLAFNLTTWFAGTVTVVVDGKGDVTVIGKIAPPAEIELFKQKDWDKQLIKFEAKAYYGIPVVGNLNLFANISLHALAKLGPAKIYNIEILGTYSTDPTIQKSIQISGSINISAYAGLRLRAEGGAGIEIASHDLKFGVGLNADVGVKAYADARPTVGYRDPGEFYISGTLDMVAQPMLGLGGDFFIELDSPWWSPAPDKKWIWPLFSKEWPLSDPIGLSATVKDYVLGSGKVPEVELKKPEFDPSKFMTSMVDKELPEKSGGKGAGQGAFKEDGSVPKPVVPPKKPEPKKADIKPGPKKAPPKGGKSAAPDPKAASQKDIAKLMKTAVDRLNVLKGKGPFTRTALDKELAGIGGVTFDVQGKEKKWVVTPKVGATKGKKGVELPATDAGVPQDSQQRLEEGLNAGVAVVNRLSGRRIGALAIRPLLAAIRIRYKFQSLDVETRDGRWHVVGQVNPAGSKPSEKESAEPTAAGPLKPVAVGSWIKNLQTKSFERVSAQASVVRRAGATGAIQAVSFTTSKPEGGSNSHLYADEGTKWERSSFTHPSNFVMPVGSSANFVLKPGFRGSAFIRPNFYNDTASSRTAIVASKLPGLLNPSNSNEFLSEAPASQEASVGYTRILNGKALIPRATASPDHDPPLADHWTNRQGNNTNQTARGNWNRNLNSFKLMSLALNLKLGSRGENFTEQVGINFKGPGE